MAGKTRSPSKRLLIAKLLGSPGLNYAEIAEKTGCSIRTVSRVAAELRPDDDEVAAEMRKYRTLVEKHLPMERRVEILREAAESVKTNPFAALKAVARADDLFGVITRRDELGKRQEQPVAPQPLFMMPPGARICFATRRERPAIDVTPEPDDTDRKPDA